MKRIYVLFLFTMMLPMININNRIMRNAEVRMREQQINDATARSMHSKKDNDALTRSMHSRTTHSHGECTPKSGWWSAVNNLFSLSAKTITIQPQKIKRRPGQNVYDFWYDLPPSELGYDWVYLYYSTDMKQHYKRAKGTRGDVGKNIKAGKDKHIIWNAEVDFPTEYNGSLDVIVKAKEKIPIPSGMKFIGKNNKGYYEVQNPKDGSVLIYIPAGEFRMGSKNGYSWEKPEHKVYLDGYYIGKYEVTVAQFRKFCNATGHKMPRQPLWNEDNYPVVNVSWNDAVAYCRWAGLRLPTEAEWEKAARGGEDYKYAGSNNPDEVGWYRSNSGNKIHPVGQKNPNGYGIYDMSGNVYEWCADWYNKHYYSDSPYKNPKGPASGFYHISRGGSWEIIAWYIRCASRGWYMPDYRFISQGFRVAL